MSMDFEKLYNTYYMEVYSYVMTLVRSSAAAEEITQLPGEPSETGSHPLPSEANVEQSILDQMETLQIHQILHKMEEPYKEVFSLRIFGELSFQNIGQIFGKTENWARVTYHRARLKIQERMKHNE